MPTADALALMPPDVAPRMALAVVDKGVLSTAEVLGRAHRIKEIQLSVMKPNVHYGVIPGTQKPTLYQPGADVLNVTFQIAPRIGKLEDLSTADAVRYRVTVEGEHQQTHAFLGEGIGECSSDEEKYRWRKAICPEEFDEADPGLKRVKWRKGQGGKAYKEHQVRTSPADLANTILKMSVKRGKIAMTLNVTGAGDVFGQDLEDLAEELRDVVEGELAPPPAVRQPQRQSAASSAAVPLAPSVADTPARVAGLRITDVVTSQAQPKVDESTGVETPGRTFYGIVLSDGAKLSTYDERLATAADVLKTKATPVRLLTATALEQDPGEEGTAVLVYTAPPAGTPGTPRLDRVVP